MSEKIMVGPSRTRLKATEISRSVTDISVPATLKYVSLFLLVFQNASQVLIIRYVRTRPKVDMFLPSTAVFWTEMVKLTTCLLIVAFQEKSAQICAIQVFNLIVRQPYDTLKVCVPSLIYTLQNNLLYVAVSNLDAATFMVTYQLKILTTAIFSVIILRKPLCRLQWIALLILFAGVSIVQIQQQQPGGDKSSTMSTTILSQSGIERLNQTDVGREKQSIGAVEKIPQSPMVGLTAVVVACLMSGFAGIYFERILKNSGQISLWLRNIQLAVLSVPISFVTMWIQDGSAVRRNGILFGYDSVVWGVVLLYACGGLLVAVVVKYADNILKGFATSISIILSTVASMLIFDYWPTGQFAVGAALVMLSVYLYSKPPPKSSHLDEQMAKLSLSAKDSGDVK